MHLVLLSGGFGKRLWPYTNDVYTKQFVPIINDKNGNKISLISSIFDKLDQMNNPFDDVTVVGGEIHKDLLNLNVKNRANIIFEPCKHDTFSAIALSCAYLYSENKLSKDSIIAVTPCDHLVSEEYYKAILSVETFIKSNNYNIVLLGKRLDTPNPQYGYIVPSKNNDNQNSFAPIDRFVEKPCLKECKELINNGALVNCGIFIFKLGYIINILENLFSSNNINYEFIINHYTELPNKSFDYEVVEKEKNIAVAKYDGFWSDIGSWSELSKIIDNSSVNSYIDDSCKNSLIINKTSLPLAAIGLNNIVVCATSDGILVSEKEESNKIKDILKDYNTRPMYEQKRWGEYFVIDHVVNEDGSEALTKRLILNSGKSISYQFHNHRKEIWTIIKGKGELTLDDKVSKVSSGDVIIINPLQKHSLKAIENLEFIEVQLGSPLIEGDIVRLNY